jgi:SAM-dependent methyltransferase
MMRAMETTIAVELVASGGFDAFLDELAGSLAKRGLQLEAGPDGRVLEGDAEVGRVTAWEPERVVIEWHSADWAPDDVTELELRADGERIRIEHRGFGRQFWGDEEIVGWFADELAAPLLAASAPRRFGDWLTDRGARRPFGIRARTDYKDPTHHRPSFGAVLSALHLTPEDVLLELACGGGAFLEHALRSGCRAVGLDHSPEMVHAARELNAQAIEEGRLAVVEGDAHELPFDDGSFTAAATMQAFFFFADAERVLTECHRVLRPSGRLAVFTVSEEAKGTPAAPEPMASRGHFYTDEQLVALARQAGFRLASVEHPELEPHARAAGLPDEVVALFVGTGQVDQLLLARR